MDLTSLVAIVLPAVLDLFKKAGERIITGRKMSVQEEIELMKAEAEKLKAIAEIDKVSEGVSKWVIDFRASFRYIFCGLILIATLIVVFGTKETGIKQPFLDILSGVTFFLIGHRTYITLRK